MSDFLRTPSSFVKVKSGFILKIEVIESKKSENYVYLTIGGGSLRRSDYIFRTIIAIPHWYGNKIQLLLPLILTNEEGIADVALVVDRDDDRKIYRGVTILTMDKAYIDARLITKPDDAWLNP